MSDIFSFALKFVYKFLKILQFKIKIASTC